LTIVALVVGSVGIGILWAAGIDFPFYPPPGIVILLAGAVFMALSSRRRVPAVGAGSVALRQSYHDERVTG
jgi:hypothetical protein